MGMRGMHVGCKRCRPWFFVEAMALIFIGVVIGYFGAAVLLTRVWTLQ